MRLAIGIIAMLSLAFFLLVVLPSSPWLHRQRRRYEEEDYEPPRAIDSSDPPPAIPEPEDDLGPGDRDVPPGSRRDRQRHGKP